MSRGSDAQKGKLDPNTPLNPSPAGYAAGVLIYIMVVPISK